MKFTRNKKFIGRMFDEISPAYDRMNHIMSWGQDIRWRKKAVKYLRSKSEKYEHILDLAAGTGDFGREFMKLNPQKLYSVDISGKMLKINKNKINSSKNNLIIADAENMPFPDDYFDLCGIAFGIRNFENLHDCLTELFRVLKSSGLLCVIEMFRSSRNNFLDKSFNLYFNKLVPVPGNLFSKSSYAYNYLNYSIDSFISADEFIDMALKIGFKLEYRKKNLLDIVHTVYLGK